MFFFSVAVFFSIPLVSILSTGRSVVLPELCRDLLDGLVLRFRHLEPDVDDEQHLGHDEDDEDVGTEKELKKRNKSQSRSKFKKQSSEIMIRPMFRFR